MVKKSFALTVDGKTYQIEVLGPGRISVDGNVHNIELEGKNVRVDDESMTASLSEGFAIVGGKLYEIEWRAK